MPFEVSSASVTCASGASRRFFLPTLRQLRDRALKVLARNGPRAHLRMLLKKASFEQNILKDVFRGFNADVRHYSAVSVFPSSCLTHCAIFGPL